MKRKTTRVHRAATSTLSGTEAETLACRHLQKHGLKLLERNFATRRGEIDLIMQHRCCLVFVEVRFRHSANYGSAEESITQRKCQRLKAAALAYLQKRAQGIGVEARFDAVAISPDGTQRGNFAINWVQNILI